MGRFRIGDRVGVLATNSDSHHRTPGYVKGKVGRIQARCGEFLDPETRAYGGNGRPERALYRVEFTMRDVWGRRYKGPAGDSLLIDIFEQWLAPVQTTGQSRETDA